MDYFTSLFDWISFSYKAQKPFADKIFYIPTIIETIYFYLYHPDVPYDGGREFPAYNLALTSKKWSKAILPLMWKRICLERGQKARIESFVNLFNKGKRFWPDSRYYLTDLQLYCPYDIITNDELKTIILAFPNIKKFGLSQGPPVRGINTAISKTAHTFFGLETLDLMGCKKISDSCLWQVAKNCLKLKRLNLNSCPNVSVASLGPIIANCKDLEKIGLRDNAWITNGLIKSLATHCKKIISINILGCRNIGADAIIDLITQNPDIKELAFGGNRSLTDSNIVHIIRNMKSLERLRCQLVRPNTFEGFMEAFVGNVSLLKFLHLEGISVTGSQIEKIIQYNSALQGLSISIRDGFVKNGIQMLCRKCPNLEFLDLDRTPGVNVELLHYMASNLENLRHLSVRGGKSPRKKMKIFSPQEKFKKISYFRHYYANVDFHKYPTYETNSYV